MSYKTHCLDTHVCSALYNIAREYKWPVKIVNSTTDAEHFIDVKKYIQIDYEELTVTMVIVGSSAYEEKNLDIFIKELQKGPSQYICTINNYDLYVNYAGITWVKHGTTSTNI
jgi:hypothetical protein